MNRREVALMVLRGERPPYVPWSFSLTHGAAERLAAHRSAEVDSAMRGHLSWVAAVERFDDIGNDRVCDHYGVIWNRSRDKDIGVVENLLLPEPTLRGFEMPDPHDGRIFRTLPAAIEESHDLLRIFGIGFSLYERAWCLRGMENLMMDMLDHPDFVHELLTAIADYNITILHEALKYDIDAVYFGDDWGQQSGLQMGPALWREFILPQLKRMYRPVREAGKFVYIHCCGDVDEVFDDLVEAGVNCFNPFQPEVMNVDELLPTYRGRLSFHGGLSTQKTLPFGTPDDVRRATSHLVDLGRDGGLIISPAHAVPGDVSAENLLAMIETVLAQSGFSAAE